MEKEETAQSKFDTGKLEVMDVPLYPPLRDVAQVREFRLLKIHPGHDDELSCELVHFMLHHSPSFRALSYTWKGPFQSSESEEEAPTEDILVDGRPLTVGKNLAIALRSMRDWHDGSENFVWADAICIDQSNYRERAYQVSIMGEIYSNADGVFVWLGEEAQDSDRAFRFMRMLAKFRRDYESGRAKTIATARNPDYVREWKALEAMMNRRWWGRAWVL